MKLTLLCVVMACAAVLTPPAQQAPPGENRLSATSKNERTSESIPGATPRGRTDRSGGPGGAPSNVGVVDAKLGTPPCIGEMHDDFGDADLSNWTARDGKWAMRDGRAVADGGFSVLLNSRGELKDAEVSADVAYSHDEAHAAAGIVFRFKDDATAYLACLREIEKGVHPEFGPWERPGLQLFRMDRDGWKLLQESKVMDCRGGRLRRIKVVCRGRSIWVFYEDMTTPVLREHDPEYDGPGRVGLLKDHAGVGTFDSGAISTATADLAPPPLQTDWSWVRGAGTTHGSPSGSSTTRHSGRRRSTAGVRPMRT